jgi:hypothetical protein
MVFGCFTMTQEVVRDYFLIFMALPPAFYFLLTLAVWGYKRMSKTTNGV